MYLWLDGLTSATRLKPFPKPFASPDRNTENINSLTGEAIHAAIDSFRTDCNVMGFACRGTPCTCQRKPTEMTTITEELEDAEDNNTRFEILEAWFRQYGREAESDE